MDAYLLSLATAVPTTFTLQEEGLQQVLNLYPFDESKKKYVTKIYQNSGIIKRHHVISGTTFFAESFPGMSARNEVYKKEAPLLAHDVAKKALAQWGKDPKEITHVISISCTGVYIPGIEFSLMNTLGLNRSIYRLGINFMGCFGAFKGFHVANAFAKEDPRVRILVVCTELCSLHLQDMELEDAILSGSLFADGAAAFIVGCEPREGEKPLWRIERQISLGLDNSTEQMTWEASDTGYKMRLSSYVPLSIAHGIQSFTQSLLQDVPFSECDFAIHPGGKAILQVIQKKLKLKDHQVQSSHEILANYGNMSSATFPFVLENLYQKGNLNPYCVGFGFGPGLSMEGILLHR